jgi:hypothetical protein
MAQQVFTDLLLKQDLSIQEQLTLSVNGTDSAIDFDSLQLTTNGNPSMQIDSGGDVTLGSNALKLFQNTSFSIGSDSATPALEVTSVGDIRMYLNNTRNFQIHRTEKGSLTPNLGFNFYASGSAVLLGSPLYLRTNGDGDVLITANADRSTATPGKIQFQVNTTAANTVCEMYNDHITLHKPITLSDGTPTTTTDKLYNASGVLHFNGLPVGGGGSSDLEDVVTKTANAAATIVFEANAKAHVLIYASAFSASATDVLIKSFVWNGVRTTDTDRVQALFTESVSGADWEEDGTSSGNTLTLPKHTTSAYEIRARIVLLSTAGVVSFS